MSSWNFDAITPRKNTNSVKYDLIHLDPNIQADPKILPMWVADMDFATAPAIIKAITSVAQAGIFGYSNRPESYTQAIITWYQEHYHYTMEKERIAFSPCVMTSMVYLLQKLVKKGDKVVIQSPVYPEFAHAILTAGASVVENPLLLQEDGRYLIDFIDLEKKLADAQAFILCSPHNPVGRVWNKEELEQVAHLIQKYQIPIISDEIHADLTLFDQQHHLFTAVAPAVASLTYTLFSASKSFNLASLHASSILFPSKEENDVFTQWLKDLHINRNNIFSLAAVESAYREGYPWLHDLLHYLEQNFLYLQERLAKEMPLCKVTPMQATYLAWIDCRALQLDAEALQDFFYHQAKIIPSMGHTFGQGGEGFIRLNIATQKERLVQALDQWQAAYQKLFG